MIFNGLYRVTEKEVLLYRAEGRRGGPINRYGRPEPSAFAGKADIEAQSTDVIAAVLDLSGFTAFCSETDSPSAIPAFLNEFLAWLFGKIEKRDIATIEADPMWREAPFFAKFLGDGIMLLWDAGELVEKQVAGLLSVMLDVCTCYRSQFRVEKRPAKSPPEMLRCRMARGLVYSVNNGRDHVGNCLNLANHLLEYKTLTFCVVREGLGISGLDGHLAEQLVTVSLPVRGVKTDQPVWTLKEEVKTLKLREGSAAAEGLPAFEPL